MASLTKDLRSFFTLSTAGTFVADQADAGEAGPRAVSAGKCDVWCGGGGEEGLPPLSFVFERFSPVRFELGSSLVDLVTSGHTVSIKVRALFVVDVTSGERLLQAALESQQNKRTDKQTKTTKDRPSEEKKLASFTGGNAKILIFFK